MRSQATVGGMGSMAIAITITVGNTIPIAIAIAVTVFLAQICREVLVFDLLFAGKIHRRSGRLVHITHMVKYVG